MRSEPVLLVSLLWLCSLASAEERCNSQLLENVDFPGSDITFLLSPDVNHCQLLCTQHPSCQFFTFLRADWTRDDRTFRCYLKSTPSGQPSTQTPLQGVTSGFSLKSLFCVANPKPCLLDVYENVDFFGADYRSLFTTDPTECQRVCTQDPGCQFFSFVNGNYQSAEIRFKCHLKFSWSIPRVPIIESKTGVTSGFSQSTPISPPFDTACEEKFFTDTDIPGSDLEKVKAASVQHCQVMCSAHPQCSYFSFVSAAFDCFLKNNQERLVTTAKVGVTSGLPARFCQLDDAWLKTAYNEVDFRGSDIRFELMDNPEQCAATCTAEPNCQFYAYVHTNFQDPVFRRRCYLKRVITMPAPPKVSKKDNVVSGFSKRNCKTPV